MPTATELLTDLININLDQLYDKNIDNKERSIAIKLAKKKLSIIKKTLRETTKEIEKQYDGRKKYQAGREKSELAPYKAIDEIIPKIELALEELLASKQEQELPSKFVVGSVLMNYGYNGYKVITRRELLIHRKKEILSERDNLIEKIKLLRESIHPMPDRAWWYELSQRIVIGATPAILYVVLIIITNDRLAICTTISTLCLIGGVSWAGYGLLFGWEKILEARRQELESCKLRMMELKNNYHDYENQLKSLPEDSN